MTELKTPTAQGLGLDDTVVTEEYTIGALCTLNGHGDTRVMWDSRNPDEVEAAKAQFDSLIAKGYLAYKAEGKEGRKGEQLKKFDKRAERVILVRPPVGG